MNFYMLELILVLFYIIIIEAVFIRFIRILRVLIRNYITRDAWTNRE